MTDKVLCMITDLHLILLKSCQYGRLGQIPKSQLAMLALTGTPAQPHQPCVHLFECYTNISMVKYHKEVGHLQLFMLKSSRRFNRLSLVAWDKVCFQILRSFYFKVLILLEGSRPFLHSILVSEKSILEPISAAFQ